MFSSRVQAHCLCRRPVRPPIQMIAKGQVGFQLKPSLRANSSYADRQPEDERIYILGTGNRANLFAHSLAKNPSPPPITLLWQNRVFVRRWKRLGNCITLVRDGVSDKQHAFDTEVCVRGNGSVRPGGQIRNLIVCTKDASATEVISKIKHRLNEKSNIFFTQKCMGKLT